MELGLSSKVAIVTGGAQGIGQAICERLAAEGAHLVVADINKAAAAMTAGTIVHNGGKAISVCCDVTDAASVEQLIGAAHDAFGTIDILVNNAGFTRDMRIGKMSEADWDSVIDVTLKGAFQCTKAVLPTMIERNAGRIINMSSRAHLGNPGQANYSAAKAGLLGFTRAMSLEVGRYFITVNAVAPGIVETEAVRSLPHFEKIRGNAEKTVAIPRMGQVSDVSDAVAFLASDRASYISGEVLHVTGGRY
ncbi:MULTISPECIES: SDR family NAD(P)-dependent oxidoreductase [unclassified Chelatococcus]|uniref:SDR family oxidoreductase n=1 Tax=unclassified Chelatococcus TaxID=2638111 RepID=UPI001BCA704D|nr:MULTISPECIES: SDR family NAD(P)-dependent oxidoreductase [unclassified Chelatococcus]MBS7700173.1 SDR family oxidoreductase [Chelatococcus sp. YT9]MBX3556866.1 SDR family oxidoreductase [Chelatococcus sp.]